MLDTPAMTNTAFSQGEIRFWPSLFGTVLHPRELLGKLASGSVPFERILALGAGYALIASVIFGLTGILSYPDLEKLTFQQGVMRFLFLTSLLFGVGIPLKVLIASLLQRYTSSVSYTHLTLPTIYSV